MPDQQYEIMIDDSKGLSQLEESLQRLWEKARLVSDQLIKLKEENKELRSRIQSLEVQERQWAEKLAQRERELAEARAQLIQAQSNGKKLLSKEETEAIKTRLKELIAKVNSRL